MDHEERVSRLDDLTSWHADWSGLRVAVLGLGATGFAAADTLAHSTVFKNASYCRSVTRTRSLSELYRLK